MSASPGPAPQIGVPSDSGGRPTRMTLVRHGQTVWHRENRYAGGGSDIDLTSVGVEQADALAAWCATQTFDAVVSSPVRRALETAWPCAAALGLELGTVDDLREVDFGVAEGRTTAELIDIDPEMVQLFRSNPAAHPYPGAESPEQAAQRAEAALRALTAKYPGGSVLVVAHNTVLRLAICALLGVPVANYRRVFPKLDNGALTCVHLPTGRGAQGSLLSLNVKPGGT